jgi:SAM-dependent methyltransferase
LDSSFYHAIGLALNRRRTQSRESRLTGSPANPYDELPYESFPVEWSAPERLALASLLHGGPRPPLEAYRVLELGCGTGANVLALAYFRRHAEFVGVDGARRQIDVAENRRQALGLTNVAFICADFCATREAIHGQFDFIIAHGVFSWVPKNARNALLELFARHLRRGGLLYLNYNCRPGWNVRGLVRDFLLAQTVRARPLPARASLAKEVSGKIATALADIQHPYSQLLGREFQFVHEGTVPWIAHEYLAKDNHPYWRSEFFALVRRHGLDYVADADFNYSSGRVPEDLVSRLDADHITGRSVDDTVDLLCYRQLHSPVLTSAPLTRGSPNVADFGNLIVASRLELCVSSGTSVNPIFKHPSGYEVEAKEPLIEIGLRKLRPLWPRGLKVSASFPDVGQAAEDLTLLQRSGLIELRCVEPGDFAVDEELLNRLEQGWAGYHTTAYHCVSRT